jgi:two-component system chemotaxis response regulator CheY
MKTLIVEDDFTSRLVLQSFLKEYGVVHIAVNGNEAVEAVRIAMEESDPYDLICLDIMMPELDGQEALREIRSLEKSKGAILSYGSRILMTTGMEDGKNILGAFREQCDGYLIKPVHKEKLIKELKTLKLIP